MSHCRDDQSCYQLPGYQPERKDSIKRCQQEFQPHLQRVVNTQRPDSTCKLPATASKGSHVASKRGATKSSASFAKAKTKGLKFASASATADFRAEGFQEEKEIIVAHS